jgi:5'-deoxynucleotidase YfbR-like HD superfamily hydrolase
MKVHVYCAERYPDYGISERPPSYERTIEISEELLAEVKTARAAYEAAQDKLQALYREQEGFKPKPPKEEHITQAEADLIALYTPAEPKEVIDAAIAAFEQRRAG